MTGSMNWPKVWGAKLSSYYFYEKTLVGSFAFIFIILSFDCWFQNLPLSGYGIIFLTLLVAGCTSFSVCHAFQHLVQDSPQHWLTQKIKKEEKDFFDRLFDNKISSLVYPTSMNEQTRLLLKDIEREFVKPWYAQVSSNPSFLFDCHLVLEEIVFKILEKLKHGDCKFIAKNILFLYLSHIQEYKRSLRRAKNCDNPTPDSKDEVTVEKMYRFAHPASSSDLLLNHYLSKVMETLVKEYAPHDLVSSLESAIVTRILARKMLKTLLVNIEDPSWIFSRCLYLADIEKYTAIMNGRSYHLKEVTEPEPVIETHKFRMKPAILSRKADLGNNIFNRTLGSKAFSGSNNDKNLLNLPLATGKSEQNISSVLGSLISSTAAPLLPENASLCYQPLNKMWLSPVTELKQEITDSVVNPLLKTITEGLRGDERKGNGLKDRFLLTRGKVLTRSKSSDAITPEDDVSLGSGLAERDVSVGEELSEEAGRRLVKTHSFDAGSSGDLAEGEAAGDVSPVYEEPEDFATTIAKLRSVLQQRESTSTLSDKSNPSTESQDALSIQNTFDSGDKGQAFDEEAPLTAAASALSVTPAASVEACDVPSDGRPFVNISIPSTEVKESSSSPYVLYTIQYDGIYVKQSEEGESQLVLQTTIVKRRFQEFLNLQTRLEENTTLRVLLKGIKGPTKWLTMPFGTKIDEATTAQRRPVLESYLQQLCQQVQLASCPALQQFMAYGEHAATAFASTANNPSSSIHKIDKFLSNKVTGVFNSIKTVLPSFEANSAQEVKAEEQNLLQGFLNFTNKSDHIPPITLSFLISDATGEGLMDDVRHLLAEKSDCIEDALDALDANDWQSETGECHVITPSGSCVWLHFKDAVLDDDLDKYDGGAPILNLVLDILCELLESADGWVTKEPVLRLLRLSCTRWEHQLKMRLSALDWDRICGNLVRLLRAAVFTFHSCGSVELDAAFMQTELLAAILPHLPGALVRVIGIESIECALNLFLDSLRHSRCNRDVIVRVFDTVLLSHLLSCPHLVMTSPPV